MSDCTFHLFLPQMRMAHDAIVERARAAEAAGFEGIAFMDHLAPPLAFEQDMWEAMSIAAWVLAHTENLRVGHLVLCDAFRHPAVLARQATSLNHTSGGRFDLGIGWGSVPEEFDIFGVGSTAPRDRVARLAESLDIIQGLWTGDVVNHSGQHFTLEGAQQRPVPSSPIPITIGGVGPKTLALVNRHADWWNIPVHELDRLDERREAAGNARVSVQVMVALVHDESQREQIAATAMKRFPPQGLGKYLAIGTPSELADHFAGLRDRGIDRFYAWFADFAPPATLERFGEVISELN